MIAFALLFLILILALVAELILLAYAVFPELVRGQRPRISRPPIRVVMALTAVELVLVLIWGLVLRPGLI